MSIYLINFLILIGVLILTWFGWRKQTLSLFSYNRIPGPKPSFWTGNLKEFIRLKDTFEYENIKKYGNIFGYFLGSKPILLINDPELIKIIQVKNFKNFCNKDFVLPDTDIPHHVGMRSLLARKDEEWKILRIILNPCFSSKKLKLMFHTFNETIDEFFENIKKESKNKNFFDIYPFYKKLTLDIICRTAFGFKSEVQKGENTLFLESLGKVLNSDSSEITSVLSVCFSEIKYIPRLLRKLIDFVRSIFGYPSVKLVVDSLKEIIHQRKVVSRQTEDLLQNMIDGKIETKLLSNITEDDLDANNDKFQEIEHFNVGNNHIKLSDDEVIGNVLTFMVFGYRSISSILAYASYYLATHLEIQEKAAEQININLKNVEYEDLAKLDYLDQIISETLRLHPVSSLYINRKAKNAFKYKGITIPGDAVIIISPRLLHRNPEYWNEPDSFKPERFSVENKKNINSANYQPFGNGPRNCIGMRFAQTIMKIVLTRILKNYKLEKPSNCILEHHQSIFGSTPKNILIHIVPRKTLKYENLDK